MDAGVGEWRTKIADTGLLVSAILAVIHPDLYTAGHETLQSLRRNSALRPAINAWPSVFNAISIISNRNCVAHRDGNTRSQWYDALVTIGAPNGDEDVTLDLMCVGVKAKYTSGSFMAMSGRLIRHTVSDCEQQRLCYAFTMKDSIHNAAGVKAAPWMEPSVLGVVTPPAVVTGDPYL